MIFITIVVEESTKEIWKVLADREGRSMENYIEWLILREQETLNVDSITLERMDRKEEDNE